MEKKILSRRGKYDYCIKVLQNEVGLTHKEARAYLSKRWEPPRGLAEHWHMSLDEVYDFIKASEEKVKATGKSESELFGEYRLGLVCISEY
jgi:hypothetical protein